MEKNKFDFIINLLENQKVPVSQREKILHLSAREIKDMGQDNDDIIIRIKKIEQSLGINNYEIGEISDIEKHLYFDPKVLAGFLEYYNQNAILKTTCHEIDEVDILKINSKTGLEEYNFQEHYKLIVAEFDIIEELVHNKKLFIHRDIMNTIRLYLTGNNYKKQKAKNGWEENIQMNWDCSALQKWIETNPNLPPNPDTVIRRKMRYNGFTFQELSNGINMFSDLVIHFKRLYHIRYDNSLRDILEKINEQNSWDNDIDFIINDDVFTRDVEFFTDIISVKKIYSTIIEMILDVVKIRKETKPVVSLILVKTEESYIFSINHTNSRFTKEAENVVKKLGKTHTNMIVTCLLGACDLYLKAEFGDGQSGIINLWNKKMNTRVFTPEPFKGVQHDLIFSR